MITITGTTGTALTHQILFESGTRPIVCSLIGAPAGVTIDADNVVRVPNTLLSGRYSFRAGCNNECDAPASVDIELVLTGTCGAVMPDNGANVIEWVVRDTPVIVPNSYFSMHRQLTIENWLVAAGQSNAVPGVNYNPRRYRTLAATANGEAEVFFWRNVETSPGEYDFSRTDQWMNAIGRSTPVTLCLSGTPEFYQKYPGEPSRWPSWPGCASPPTNAGLVALRNFAQVMKQRYPNIDEMEVWNEPTFPWGRAANDFDFRWTPSWANANVPGNKAPFFSGSPTDLANIAAALKSAAIPGLKIVGCAWVDVFSANNNVIDRFANAPVTFNNLGGTGKDYIDENSIHLYKYGPTAFEIYDKIKQFKAKFVAVGMGDKPIQTSENGSVDSGWYNLANSESNANDIKHWMLIPAAFGFTNMAGYIHAASPRERANFGDPAFDPVTQAMLLDYGNISGKQICAAGVLPGQRFWVYTADGRHWYSGN